MNTAYAAEDLVKHTEDLVAGLKALPSNKRFSAETLEAVYGLAYNMLQQRQHEGAMRYFAFLMVYAPTDPRFVAGLAMTHQLAGNHEQALQLYSLATYLQPDRPHYLLRMAECFVHLGNHAVARQFLELTVRFCQEGKRDEPVRLRAQAVLELLPNEPAAA